MTAHLTDGIRLDGTPTEISDALRLLGLGRPAPGTPPSGAYPAATAIFGMDVIASPAPDDPSLRGLLSGEATAWDDDELDAA